MTDFVSIQAEDPVYEPDLSRRLGGRQATHRQAPSECKSGRLSKVSKGTGMLQIPFFIQSGSVHGCAGSVPGAAALRVLPGSPKRSRG